MSNEHALNSAVQCSIAWRQKQNSTSKQKT